MADYDVIVIGGGLVGAAIGFGLSRLGQKTAILDEGDVAHRAARGNFGLVWVQGKGDGCPAYANWTRRSAGLWPQLADELSELSGMDLVHERSGGVHLCLDEAEFEQRSEKLKRMAGESQGADDYQMLGHDALAKLLPGLGPSVAGGSFSPGDGHVNPLILLRALHHGFRLNGGQVHIGAVKDLRPHGQGFRVRTLCGEHSAGKLVLAAGLGNRHLAPCAGLNVPVSPERGQILVTERLKPFLKLPTIYVRQTAEGSVLLGDSHEDTGFDDGTSPAVMGHIARRARALFPHLAAARIVRAWGALRVLTPDGLPVYDGATDHPGAFSASSHSGVTLAAVHALDYARFIQQGQLPASLDALSERRFHVH